MHLINLELILYVEAKYSVIFFSSKIAYKAFEQKITQILLFIQWALVMWYINIEQYTLYTVHCTGLFETEAENINCGETSVNDNYRLR